MRQVGGLKNFTALLDSVRTVLKYWSVNVHKAPYIVENTGALDPDTRVDSQFLYLLTLKYWISQFPSLTINFFMYTIGIIIPISQGFYVKYR